MQWTQRSAAFLAFLTLGFCLLAGCNRSETGSENETSSSVASNGAVATVTTPKGTVLTLTEPEFYTQLQNYVPNPNPTFGAPGQPVGQAVMQQMLLNLLVEGLAADQGVAATDAEVETQYQNTKMVAEANNIKTFDQQLMDAGLTSELFKDLQVRPELAHLNLLTKGMTVSDADIKSYYDQHQKDFTKPERAHIKRIALATSGEAQQISNLIKGGQSFESQVPRSLDKTTPEGDVAQWVSLDTQNTKIAALITQIRATGVGQTTAPIPVPGPDGHNTYWLVKIVEKRPKENMSIADLKDLIRFNLLRDKAKQNSAGQEALGQQLRAFQTQAKIAIIAPQYAALQQALAHPPAPGLSGGSPFGTPQP